MSQSTQAYDAFEYLCLSCCGDGHLYDVSKLMILQNQRLVWFIL